MKYIGKGSYTIEAAILMPILCMIFLLMILTAYQLYEEIYAQASAKDKPVRAVTYFYISQEVGEVLDD